MSKPRLLIFDVDGTLLAPFTLPAPQFLPCVVECAAHLRAMPHAERPALAIATNQGGVGLRRWMETGAWGTPGQYPTQAEIESGLAFLTAHLFAPLPFVLLVCYAYQSKKGTWAPNPPEAYGPHGLLLPEWSQSWRKPAPGMVEEACRRWDTEDYLLIGDSDEDRKAAGDGHFMAAAEFFGAEKWREVLR